MASDSELLRAYARDSSEKAFEEFVRAHIDLVYSAALRRVSGNTHLAKEITQQVFIAAARNAQRLSAHPVLNAWLFTCTRNAAANALRAERRRELGKQKIRAMENVEPSTESKTWDDIRAAIDPALDALSETDRRIVILRYLEGRSYTEIASILLVSVDAARMRAERALQRLRTRMQRAGITSSALLISTALSGKAVVSAPAGLAASVTAAATAQSATATAGGITLLMSTPKVTGIALGCVAAALTAYFATREAPRSERATEALAPMPIKPDQTSRSTPTPLETAVSRHRGQRTTSTSTMEAEEKIAALKDVLSRLPEQSIPELKLATNGDWHGAVDGPLESTDDYRRALARIRAAAEGRLAKFLQPAVRQYVAANGGAFPTDPAQLQALASDSVTSEMLARYRVAPASEIPNVRMGGDRIITQRRVVDSGFDHYIVIGPNGFGSTSVSPDLSRDLAVARPAMLAYKEARGERHRDLNEVIPFATSAEQKEAIQRILQREKGQSGP